MKDKSIGSEHFLSSETIYVENVRRLLDVSFNVAKEFCDTAVREGVFENRIAVRCPKCGRTIMSVASQSDVPEEIECETCSALEEQECRFGKSEIKTMEFYRVKEGMEEKARQIIGLKSGDKKINCYVYSVGRNPIEAIDALGKKLQWGELRNFNNLGGNEEEYDWGYRFTADGTSMKVAGINVVGGVILTWWK